MDATQSSEATRSTVAFLAELIRLQHKVHELDRQLDALEAGMRRALNDLTREVYEACR
jgi:hypothetical protein